VYPRIARRLLTHTIPRSSNSAASDADEMDCVLMAGTPETGPLDRLPSNATTITTLSPALTTPAAIPEESASPNAVVSDSEAMSPHKTQGAPGHVAKVKASIESGEVVRKSKDGGGKLRKSLNVIGGFKKATSGLMAKLRASRDAPETPVRRPSPKAGAVDAGDPTENVAAVSRGDLEAGGFAGDDAATLEEEEQRRVEEEIALAERLSPGLVAHAVGSSPNGVSPGMEPTVIDQSPTRTRSKFELPDDTDEEEETDRLQAAPVEQTDVTMSMSPVHVADVSVDKENNEHGRPGVTFAATPDEIRSANSSRDDLQNSQYSPEVAPLQQRDGNNTASGWGKPPMSKSKEDAHFVSKVTARQMPDKYGAMFASMATPPAKVFGSGRGGVGGSYNDRMSGAGMIRKSSHSKAHSGDGGKGMMTPLPISKNVLERIDALGPEMQPMQKYILIAGIMLDFYAKSQLIRELNRFANNADWGWFVMVFLFFLLSGSMTAMYWVLHYPMPTKAEIAKAQNEHQTKVFGFTKIDFKRMVRNAGAVASMCMLGTPFAAWRALRTNDLRQRKAEMDLRGMQLVDTVFLILPVATLQAYVGMSCSSPESQCPGRNGFDALLFLAVLGAITSGTLCFVSLDLHEKPPSYTWAQYWAAHKAHLSEMAAKTVFRFLELSARITTIALFSAAHGGWVFFIFFMHAVIVLVALKFWPKLVGGGVPDRNVWQKFVATKETVVKARFWPDNWRRLKVAILDDSKLLLAVMIWPPSMFVANATDKNGKFWWRSKTCPRKSFLSVNRVDAIFPLPAVVAVQVFEAMLMLVIVGASISQYPHYHNYYMIAFLANMAWLCAAVGWMSAASLWNPFLPEGPPLGLPTATLHPGRTPGRPAREEEDAPETEWRPHEGWGGDTPMPAGDVKSIGGALAAAAPAGDGRVTSSVDAGIFSPSGKTPGARARTRMAGRTPAVRASYAAGDGSQGSWEDDEKEVEVDETKEVDEEKRPDPEPETSPRALNFTSVPEDFKYDFAAERAKRLAALKATQEAAAEAQLAAHRRTDSGGSAKSEQTASPSPAAQPKGGISFDRLRGGLDKRGGYVPGQPHTMPGRVHASTSSTVSSLATPPFPGASKAGVRSSTVSNASESDVSMAVDATLTAAVHDVSGEDENGDPWSYDPWGERRR
jgi:hypothetical protein